MTTDSAKSPTPNSPDGKSPDGRSLTPKAELALKLDRLARRHFGKPWEALGWSARQTLGRIADQRLVSRDLTTDLPTGLTLGQRVADKVAAFGGSWTFIFTSLGLLLGWIFLNAAIIGNARAFDPYPFILLNLFLSMLAALQAPIIMMSQNRQGEKDRAAAQHDYEVNLKAEIEIMALHDRLEALRDTELKQILDRIEALAADIRQKGAGGPS